MPPALTGGKKTAVNRTNVRSVGYADVFLHQNTNKCSQIVKKENKMGYFKRDDYTDFHRHSTVCAQCGYRFASGDEAYMIKATGDIIHRDCFSDYTEDNMYEFADKIEY